MTRPHRITMLMQPILDRHGISRQRFDQQKGKGWPQVTRAREEMALRLHAEGMTMPQIAMLLKLHHTSVLYYLKKHGKLKCQQLKGEAA